MYYLKNGSHYIKYIVTCIARQQTDKHLVTEYTYATIEYNYYVTGCLAMTKINTRLQQYGMRLFSMRSVPRLYHPRYKYNRSKYKRLKLGDGQAYDRSSD
jgi:hypothetical protein